jgi:hypothetical protein
MTILRWFIENWDNIMIIAVLIWTVISVVIKTVKKWKTMTNEERIAYVKRLLENLLPIAIKLVSDAERRYGSGTGPLKRSDVIDALYARIPDEFKPYVTEANLDTILETALEKARVIWEDNFAVNKIVIQQKPSVMGFSAKQEDA